MVCGVNPLNPLNEQWLFGGGDATQHYFGWLFYRNSPWSWPLGLNLDYGIGLNNSIVFTDSIPLLAIPFKALSKILPQTFQYFGLWALLCFELQAFFAWKLIRLYSDNVWICSICTGLFIFSVPMLSLFPENPALGSLFLVLAALYLSLKYKKYPAWSWFLLLTTTSLIHFYLFVLVGAIWVGSLLDGIFIKKCIRPSQAIKALLISIPSVLILAYLAGYFTISSIGAFGYGMFKINVLGLFNPSGWSSFIKATYTKSHWWSEEPIYFGLGGMLLLIAIISKGSSSWHLVKKACGAHVFLSITLIALAIFSISNNVAIGPLEFSIPISEKIASLASILRNSGRMFIPPFYALLLLACYLVFKQFQTRYAIGILISCLLLQIVDLSIGWLDVRQRMTSNGPFPLSKIPLDHFFWKDASKYYKSIIVIPSRHNLQPDFMARFLGNEWRVFGRFASSNGMATNAVYLARYDEPKSLEMNRQYLDQLNLNKLSPGNIYVIHPDEINTAACSMLQSEDDLFARIDGHQIYVPQYFKTHSKADGFDTIKPAISNVGSNQLSTAPYALCGTWSKPESWGTWSDGRLAKIYIPIANPSAKKISLHIQAFVNGNHPEQKLEYAVDGQNYQKIILQKFNDNQIQFLVSGRMRTKGYALIEIRLLNPISPYSLGMGDDRRELGIGLTKVQVN